MAGLPVLVGDRVPVKISSSSLGLKINTAESNNMWLISLPSVYDVINPTTGSLLVFSAKNDLKVSVGTTAGLPVLVGGRVPAKSSSPSIGLTLNTAESDNMWLIYLPSNYDVTDSTLVFSAENDLNVLVSRYFLFNNDTWLFWLDDDGKRCNFVGAQAEAITIEWAQPEYHGQYWRFVADPDSWLPVVAQLVRVNRLEIYSSANNIDASFLSPNTNYAAYFVYKIEEGARGLTLLNATLQGSNTVMYLVDDIDPPVPGEHPHQRDDGWTEVKMGEFRNNGTSINFLLIDPDDVTEKSGLIFEGIEFRPA